MCGEPENAGIDQSGEIDVVCVVNLCVQRFSGFRDKAGEENVNVFREHPGTAAQERARRHERKAGAPDADPVGTEAVLRAAAKK